MSIHLMLPVINCHCHAFDKDAGNVSTMKATGLWGDRGDKELTEEAAIDLKYCCCQDVFPIWSLVSE